MNRFYNQSAIFHLPGTIQKVDNNHKAKIDHFAIGYVNKRNVKYINTWQDDEECVDKQNVLFFCIGYISPHSIMKKHAQR